MKTNKQTNPKTHTLHFRLTENELNYIKQKASESGLTPSAYARKSCLNAKLNSVLDLDAVKDLIKISANLGRLGGLFRLWQTSKKTLTCQCKVTTNDKTVIMRLLEKTYSTQNLLCDKIDEILLKQNSKR